MAENPRIVIDTDKGTITAELFPGMAPETVANFLKAVDAGHYSGLIFHRVIKGFMIQGGGMDQDMREKEWTEPPVKNEAATGLSNERGTMAMARTSDPHSATVQFFINTVNNARLNHTSATPHGYGYCAFGRVVEGMAVVDAIEESATTTRAGHQNVPAEPVMIKGIARAKGKKKAKRGK